MQDDTTLTDLARLAAHWSANLSVSCTRDRFSVRVLTSTGRRELAAGEGPTMRVAAVHALDALRMLDRLERGVTRLRWQGANMRFFAGELPAEVGTKRAHLLGCAFANWNHEYWDGVLGLCNEQRLRLDAWPAAVAS